MITAPGHGSTPRHRSEGRTSYSRFTFTVLQGGKHRRQRLVLTLLVVLFLVPITAVIVLAHTSFRRSAVVQDLEEATGTELQVRAFRRTYFPHPGCVLEGLTFAPGRAPEKPMMTIQKLTVTGSYLRLLAHYVPYMRADGMYVIFPPFGSNLFSERRKSKTVVGQFLSDNAIVEFTPRNSGAPRLGFLLHHFVIHELASSNAMRFESTLSNPKPPGEITISGSVGPWKDETPGQTQLEGSYKFERANLGSFDGIAGILFSRGKFHGTFKDLAVEGSTDTPNFEVKRSQHPTHLTTNFYASVDATNGDVTLHQVGARFWNTTLLAQGTVDGKHGGDGKAAQLDFVGRNGRIEDLMMLFIRDRRSPIAGVVSLRARTTLPPGDAPFLKKVGLEGDFGIDDARFTNSLREQQMTELSERARGNADKLEDGELAPDRIVSDLKGHVVVKNGMASFSKLTFTVPGATAEMQGTYDLISERINLRGTLHMAAKLSEATTGVKSFLLKIINPFTKKDKPNEPISFRITGTYDKPEYSVSP